MSKIRIKLDGLKSQKKTGIAKLYFGDDVLEIPLSLKDDRKTRQVVRLQDHKYLTRLTEEGKFTTTKLVKLSQLKPEYREVIIQSEGFNADHNSFIKLYDENVLDIVADDRNVMQNAVLSIINIDFDYIVDEEKGLRFIDYLNSQFLEEITEKFKTPLLSNDYYKIAELLFEVGILSNESIMELNLYITSLKRNTSYDIEKWRIEARLMDLNEEDYIKYKTEEEELRKEFDKSNSDTLEDGEVEIVDEVVDILPKSTTKKAKVGKNKHEA